MDNPWIGCVSWTNSSTDDNDEGAHNKRFPVVSISIYRDGLEVLGYDTSRLDDEAMAALAQALANYYDGKNSFWGFFDDYVVEVADLLGIPQREEE